jgi:hypothetical protein
MESAIRAKIVRNRVRLIAGAILNIALSVYFIPRHEHLRDIQDYRYVTLSNFWVYATVAVPTFALMILSPVIFSDQRLYRWIAISLSFFPAFLALAGWVQLLMVWRFG